MTCTSEDFLQWSEPRWLQYPGAPRAQLYLNQIRPYYRAPHLLVGFPGRFMAGREIEKGLPITEHPSYRHGSISETLFMSSRDGLSFKRWGEAFIRPGPRRERWIYPASFPAYGLLVTPGGNGRQAGRTVPLLSMTAGIGLPTGRPRGCGATPCGSTASSRPGRA